MNPAHADGVHLALYGEVVYAREELGKLRELGRIPRKAGVQP
jgi:hypothetical protein